jgi:aerotaxis receptor
VQTLDAVVDRVAQMKALIETISTATQEQAQGIAQLGQAVALLDQMTQQNAAMVEQSTGAAISMSDQAVRLMDAVKVFAA